MKELMHAIVADVHYAMRRLTHTRSLTLSVIVTLAFGIGGNTAVFSVVNGILLKPERVIQDPRLVKISMTERGRLHSERMLNRQHLEHLRMRPLTQVEHVGGMRQFRAAALLSGESRVLNGEGIFGDYFSLLGARAVVGQLFRDTAPGAEQPVVISERLWRSTFSSSSDIIGKVMNLGGDSYTIVGVLPSTFRGLVLGNLLPYDVWVPRSNAPGLSRDDYGVAYLIARLKPHVSVKAANAEMTVNSMGIDPARPEIGLGIEPLMQAVYSGPPTFFVAAAAVLFVSSLVFLTAVANLINLLLTSVWNRAHELAVRQMLGANRAQVLALLAVETSLMVLGGLLAGLAVAVSVVKALRSVPLPERGGIVPVFDASPDWRVLCFAFVTAVAVVFVVTAALARQASKIEALAAASSVAGGGGSTRSEKRLGSRLLTLQVAGAVALLVNTSIVIHTRAGVLSWDPGIVTSGSVVGRVDFRLQTEVQNPARLESLVEQLGNAPGVTKVAAATSLPGHRGLVSVRVSVPDRPAEQGISSHILAASPAFIGTLGLRLLQGRDFSQRDARSTEAVAIVSEGVVSKGLLGPEPIGKFVRITDTRGAAIVAEVIGLVSDVNGSPDTPSEPFVIVPLRPLDAQQVLLVMRGTMPQDTLLRTLRETVRAIMPTVALQDVGPLSRELLGDTYSLQVAAVGMCAIGAIGGAIALLGVYSIASYRISTRGREFGLRAALGATHRHIYALVFWETKAVTILGVVAGVILAAPIGFVTKLIIPRIHLLDPLAFIVVPVVFLVVAQLAAAFPLMKLLDRDPSLGLRSL